MSESDVNRLFAEIVAQRAEIVKLREEVGELRESLARIYAVAEAGKWLIGLIGIGSLAAAFKAWG